MSNGNLNALLPEFDGEIIDIKLAINDDAKPSSSDIIEQMNRIIAEYNKGQTTEFSDY